MNPFDSQAYNDTMVLVSWEWWYATIYQFPIIGRHMTDVPASPWQSEAH